jgi:hypothetical protein
MNETDGQKLTFLDIFRNKGYWVEIPIIQRDYAHGRESASRVRNNFLMSLHRSLKEDEPLDLDFIYGSVSDGKLIPLDGQQRLTTLFLLHWYLASKEGCLESFNNIIRIENRSKFTYETRTTSREFCNALIAHEVEIPSSITTNISDIIKDAQWFYISWEKDPTIKSMLVMLDAIHEKFIDSIDYYKKLSSGTDNPLISFQFIELKDFGLSDSLYIKMNARGKELTSFENFKAKFEKVLEIYDTENGTNLKENFSSKIDTVWPDIFWKYRDKKTNSFDEKIMNFIRILATNEYVVNSEITNYIDIGKLINARVIEFDDFVELGCLNTALFSSLINTLDTLSNNGKTGIKEYLSDNSLLSESQLFQGSIDYNLSYPERIQLYGLYSYLNEFGNTDKLTEWIRVVRNLTENTRIDEIPDYVSALKSINQLFTHSNEILEYVSDASNEIRSFTAIQVSEERLKALLIQKSDRWKQAIVNIENHGYFKGQIGFILKFSGITDYYRENTNVDWSTTDDEGYFVKFSEYSLKANSVFSQTGLRKFNDYPFERALLCKGNYTLSKGLNNSFLVDSDRDIGWKRLLRDDNRKRDYVKELLDDLGKSEIEKDLQSIINLSTVTDWRRYFIEYPEMIGACGLNKYIRWESKDDILLLQRTKTNGSHSEYYSYALCVKLRRTGNTVLYMENNSVDYWKYIYYINGHATKIYYAYSTGGQWQYVVTYEESTNRFDSQDEVLTYLTNQKII